MCRHDPIIAAKIIHAYIHKNGVLQRDIVRATGLSQSHLSQHLNNGTSMNLAKRRKLYEWYVEDQRQYSHHGERLSLDTSVLEDPVIDNPPKRSRSSTTRSSARRTKVKWGAEALKVLNDAYAQNPRPSKEQRMDIVRKCAQLESENMENKLAVPGGETGEVAVVTEERVLTWFANKRKDELQRNKLQQAEAAVRLASAQTNETHHVLPSETVQVDAIQGTIQVSQASPHVLLTPVQTEGGGQTNVQFVQVSIDTGHGTPADLSGTTFVMQNAGITLQTTGATDGTPGATFVVDGSTLQSQVTTTSHEDQIVTTETVEVSGEVTTEDGASGAVVVDVETEVPVESLP
jgi:hypothetical protein